MKRFARAVGHVARTRAAELVGRTPPGPMMVFVEVTRRCNLRCRHCDIWQTAKKDPELIAREMPAPLLLRVLGEMAADGLMAVDFFGGEPLLRRDLEDIVRGARELGLHVTVTTNGMLLDAARVERLAAAGVEQILVSVDGSTPAIHDDLRGREGAWQRAVDGLAAIAERAPHIERGIDLVINRTNVADLPAMVELASELGLGTLRFLPYHACYPFERFEDPADDSGLALAAADVEHLEAILPAVRRRLGELGVATNAAAYLRGVVPFFRGETPRVRCAAGSLVCDINAAGDVFACYTLEQCVGNVREAPFRELWRRPVLQQHRAAVRRDGCDGCWQSCYVEPALRTDPRVALREPLGLLREIRRYITG